jgi:hypothetical protein
MVILSELLICTVIMIVIGKLLGGFESVLGSTTKKDNRIVSHNNPQQEKVTDEIANIIKKESANKTDSILSISKFQNPIHTSEQNIVGINIESDEFKIQAAIEIIDVPKGVVIRVNRIRTVEHTVTIEWGASISGKGEAGIKQFITASIQGEIQRVKGYVSKQSESTEYDIKLDGDKNSQYKLVWIDVWLKGTVDIQDNNDSYKQPFKFRDRTELKIVPIISP